MQDLTTLLMAPAEGGGGHSLWIMLLMMFGVMYFFMIRPQAKRAKKQQTFREELGKGDRVITSGGIHGKISGVSDTTFIIDTEGGGKLKIEKSSVSMESSMAMQVNQEK